MGSVAPFERHGQTDRAPQHVESLDHEHVGGSREAGKRDDERGWSGEEVGDEASAEARTTVASTASTSRLDLTLSVWTVMR